jgi:fimbrial chaperone protein
MNSKVLFYLITLLLNYTLSANISIAMSVSPNVIDMTTIGGGRTGNITVVNDSAKQIPIEIVISRLELDEKGEMTLTPSGDEFLVFPAQALMAPGATQIFRIQWVGDAALQKSQSYTFSVNQVPVKLPEGKNGVQIVFNFRTVVNVAPPDGRATVAVLNSSVVKDEKGKTFAEVNVSNSGNSYAKLSDSTIKLAAGSWSETVDSLKLRQSIGVGLVQPGKNRKFKLPVELPAGVSSVTAQIYYNSSK